MNEAQNNDTERDDQPAHVPALPPARRAGKLPEEVAPRPFIRLRGATAEQLIAIATNPNEPSDDRIAAIDQLRDTVGYKSEHLFRELGRAEQPEDVRAAARVAYCTTIIEFAGQRGNHGPREAGEGDASPGILKNHLTIEKLIDFINYSCNEYYGIRENPSPAPHSRPISCLPEVPNPVPASTVSALPTAAEDAEAKSVVEAYQKATESLETERLRLAVGFQPHFNAFARNLPAETYEEKKASVKILNAELRARGFAAKCPKTGAASFLIAAPGDDITKGRIQFAHIDDNNKVKRTCSRNLMPVIELTLRVEVSSQENQSDTWVDKEADRKSGGHPGRK